MSPRLRRQIPASAFSPLSRPVPSRLISPPTPPPQILWTFSIYLESVAILPQLFMVSKTGEAETITSHYLFALGVYRTLYLFNWIWRYHFEGFFDLIAIVAGLVQTVLYCDFFYLYITKGSRLQGTPLLPPPRGPGSVSAAPSPSRVGRFPSPRVLGPRLPALRGIQTSSHPPPPCGGRLGSCVPRRDQQGIRGLPSGRAASSLDLTKGGHPSPRPLGILGRKRQDKEGSTGRRLFLSRNLS